MLYSIGLLEEKKVGKSSALWFHRSLKNPVFAVFLDSGTELETSVNKQ